MFVRAIRRDGTRIPVNANSHAAKQTYNFEFPLSGNCVADCHLLSSNDADLTFIVSARGSLDSEQKSLIRLRHV